MKSTLVERLTSLMLEKNVTQAELSKRTGITQSSLSDYIKGKYSPKQDKIDLIARALGVSPAYLMGWDDAPQTPFDANVELIEIPESVVIPVYGKIAAGEPIEAIEDIEEYIDIPAEWVKSGKKFIGLTVQGDSMYPKFWEGDIVVIEVTPDANSGDICAVYVNGYEATLKSIKLSGDNITLSPFNTVYPPKTYKREEIGILGIVRELRRKI